MQIRSKTLAIVITSLLAVVVSVVLLQAPRFRGASDLPSLSKKRIELRHMFRGFASSKRLLPNYNFSKARPFISPSSTSAGNAALGLARGITAKASRKAGQEPSSKKIHTPSTSQHASFPESLGQLPVTMTNPSTNGTAAAAARSEMPTDEKHGNFDCVRRVTLDYAPGMSVEKWVSRVTGLTVVWANFESELFACVCFPI